MKPTTEKSPPASRDISAANSSHAFSDDEPRLESTLGADLSCPDRRSALKRPEIIGHRGSVYDEPENTIQSFKAAIDHGCEAVELDVFLLKCGDLAVFHGDGSDALPGGLRSYCGVDGSIVNLSAEEAKELEFKGKAHFCPDDKLEEATIPMLDEVLKYAKESGVKLKIELKGPGTEEPVLHLVEKMDMVNQCTFSSFYHDRIGKVRKLRPQVHGDGTHIYRTAALFTGDVPDDFIERSREVGATEIHLRYDTCTKERVDAIHDAGFDSMAWYRGPTTMKQDVAKFQDLEDEDCSYEMVLQSGIQAMCVNKPKALVKLASRIEDDDGDC